MIDIWLIEVKTIEGEWSPVISLGIFLSEEIASKEANNETNKNTHNSLVPVMPYRHMRYVPCTNNGGQKDA